jgi:glutathione S-transferase
MKAVRRARRHMGLHLDALAHHLDGHGGPWIAGERFTLADVSWAVILDRLVEADWDGHFWADGRRPAIAAYWGRLEARPTYRRAILDARAAISERGIADLKHAKATDARLRVSLEPPETASHEPSPPGSP